MNRSWRQGGDDLHELAELRLRPTYNAVCPPARCRKVSTVRTDTGLPINLVYRLEHRAPGRLETPTLHAGAGYDNLINWYLHA